MTLSTGTRIGVYEVVAPLGAGGSAGGATSPIVVSVDWTASIK